MEEKKPQVNVQLEPEEYKALTAICEKECILRPATLVGIWIRENIKAHAGIGELVALVTEAKESGVNVDAVIRRAIRRQQESQQEAAR